MKPQMPERRPARTKPQRRKRAKMKLGLTLERKASGATEPAARKGKESRAQNRCQQAQVALRRAVRLKKVRPAQSKAKPAGRTRRAKANPAGRAVARKREPALDLKRKARWPDWQIHQQASRLVAARHFRPMSLPEPVQPATAFAKIRARRLPARPPTGLPTAGPTAGASFLPAAQARRMRPAFGNHQRA